MDLMVSFSSRVYEVRWKSGYWEPYLNHACDGDELDKRKKESLLLLKAGGFICFLLNEPFIDKEDNRDFRGSIRGHQKEFLRGLLKKLINCGDRNP